MLLHEHSKEPGRRLFRADFCPRRSPTLATRLFCLRESLARTMLVLTDLQRGQWRAAPRFRLRPRDVSDFPFLLHPQVFWSVPSRPTGNAPCLCSLPLPTRDSQRDRLRLPVSVPRVQRRQLSSRRSCHLQDSAHPRDQPLVQAGSAGMRVPPSAPLVRQQRRHLCPEGVCGCCQVLLGLGFRWILASIQEDAQAVRVFILH